MPRRRSMRRRGGSSASRPRPEEPGPLPVARHGTYVPSKKETHTSASSQSKPKKRSYVVLPFGIRVIRQSWYFGLVTFGCALVLFSILILYVVRQQVATLSEREERALRLVSAPVVDQGIDVNPLSDSTPASRVLPVGELAAPVVSGVTELPPPEVDTPPDSLESILRAYRVESGMSDVQGAILRGRYVEDGREFSLKLMARAPDLVRKDLSDSALRMVYSFNGEEAKVEIEGEDRELYQQPLSDVLHQHALVLEGAMFGLVSGVLPDEMVYTREPDQTFAERTCWTIRRRVSTRQSMLHLIDSETRLEVVRFVDFIHEGQQHQIALHLSDYRPHGDGILPFAYTLKFDGQIRGEASIQSIKLDPGLMPWMF